MNKILIAVDDTRTSKAILSTFRNLVSHPEDVILLHVERIEGKSLMIEMLGEAELSTLKESLNGTEHKEALDKKAERILSYLKKELQYNLSISITSVIRTGRPSEEILKLAGEENVDLILLGSHGRKGLNRLISGSVAADVQKNAKIPVLVARRPVICEEAYSWRDAYAAISITTIIILGMLIMGAIL
jgi:nucleotide-binding universal stress UspA family protein